MPNTSPLILRHDAFLVNIEKQTKERTKNYTYDCIMISALFCACYVPIVNEAGIVAGFFTSMFLRFASGEPALPLDHLIEWPWYLADYKLQRFPFRTCICISTFIVFIVVSFIAEKLFGIKSRKIAHGQVTNYDSKDVKIGGKTFNSDNLITDQM